MKRKKEANHHRTESNLEDTSSYLVWQHATVLALCHESSLGKVPLFLGAAFQNAGQSGNQTETRINMSQRINKTSTPSEFRI